MSGLLAPCGAPAVGFTVTPTPHIRAASLWVETLPSLHSVRSPSSCCGPWGSPDPREGGGWTRVLSRAAGLCAPRPASLLKGRTHRAVPATKIREFTQSQLISPSRDVLGVHAQVVGDSPRDVQHPVCCSSAPSPSLGFLGPRSEAALAAARVQLTGGQRKQGAEDRWPGRRGPSRNPTALRLPPCLSLSQAWPGC